MLQKLFKLFSKSGSKKKDRHPLQDDINEQIHKILTGEIIDSTSDDQLLQVVFDNLLTKLPAGFEKEYEIVMTWNKSRQAIYLIWNLESQVNNGGYDQFYFNSSGRFYKHVPDALKLVGANKFAGLTERANKMHESENEEIAKHQANSTEGLGKSDDDNPLDEFDTAFYELYKTEELEKIQVEFIRKNKAEFIDK